MTLGPLLVGLYVFVLASFVGLEVIGKVPPTLHTPLMSGANAISGITIVGAIATANAGEATASSVLGAIALAFATLNVVGGFLVTDRMLRMFGGKKKSKS
ncbi:MAG TPA: NAD(P) transhydrogenase subunit alpha [Polyangiaceae bacterium LLY-WYZ-14_1]|jgi:NAD(P) transhydrogenase subunit alpha|nr:NAD(P) transhydrogenase subunit alpha [Polyangiaceae bacterium LLY-WYZ-14_1]